MAIHLQHHVEKSTDTMEEFMKKQPQFIHRCRVARKGCVFIDFFF